MKSAGAWVVILGSVVALSFSSASAIERVLIREWLEPKRAQAVQTPCALSTNTNGTCANYRWYNVCSGYIWIYTLAYGEGVGVLFGGDSQPCVAPGNEVKRVITYYRNTYPSYGGVQWNVYLDRDNQGDGCPDGALSVTTQSEPGLRWNCWNLGYTLPDDTWHVIVRQVRRGSDFAIGRLATDGPYTANCDPDSPMRSFYYGINGAQCRPWVGPTGDYDNFLMWLVIDGEMPNAAKSTTWGAIKALYR
ncbi:MAG: hypothetical protein ACKVU1_03595 [bacterium]